MTTDPRISSSGCEVIPSRNAPAKSRRTARLARAPERKDALVLVPTAFGGLARGVTPEQEPLKPEELVKFLAAENERLSAEVGGLRADVAGLRSDLKLLGESASMVSSVALSLTRMAIDEGRASERNEVTIPKWLHDQMLGASITLGRDEQQGITVQLREAGRERVAVRA